MLSPIFVVQYSVSYLVMLASRWEESHASCFAVIAFLDAMWLLVFCIFFSVPWVGLYSVVCDFGILLPYSLTF